MEKIHRCCYLLFAMLTISRLSFAQGACIKTVLDCFSDNYVDAEICSTLRDSLFLLDASGDYTGSVSNEELILKLSADLRRLTGDKHVRINFIEQSDRTEGIYHHSILSPPKTDLETGYNYFIRRAEWLPGNIGYLRFDAFADPQYAGEKMTAALSLLNSCEAIIIDLRYNGGGEEEMVKFLAAWFLEETTLLNQIYFPRLDSMGQSWTPTCVPGKKMAGTDLYILTGMATASAAEAFTYSLKALGRATIVGEKSNGAAHWVDYFYYPALQMEIKLPVARPVNPITKTNWEKTGITPDIIVPEYLAFEKAYRAALEKKLPLITDKKRLSDIKWSMRLLDEKIKDEKFSNVNLEDFSGKYENLEFMVKENKLFWHQPDGTEYQIVQLSKDNFVFTDTEDYIIRFIRNSSGKVTGYQFLIRWRTDNPVYNKL